MEVNYLVSICIPTYNRSDYLRKSIESILVQPEFKNGLVEVVISDNASTDNTEIIGSEYAEKYHNISYYRNKINVRDENFPIALSRGKGILRKLCNDTIIYREGCLKKLCDIVLKFREEKPLIFLTNQGADYKKRIVKFREFVINASYNITWIGSFSIWNSDCEELLTDKSGCELLLWQVKKSYELGYRKDRCVIVDGGLFDLQSVKNKDISYGLFKIFYVNYMKLLLPYVYNKSIKEEDKEFIEKDLLYNFFTGFIISWELSNSDKVFSTEENLKELVFKQYEEKDYFWKYKLEYKFKKFKKFMRVKYNIKL